MDPMLYDVSAECRPLMHLHIIIVNIASAIFIAKSGRFQLSQACSNGFVCCGIDVLVYGRYICKEFVVCGSGDKTTHVLRSINICII